MTARDVDEALTAIGETGLWLRYEVDGKCYIAFPPSSWFKHQNYIPTQKRSKDKSAFPTPQNPAYQLPETPAEDNLPQIPADPRTLPQIAEERCESPQIPASLSPSPTPTVDTDGIGNSRERCGSACAGFALSLAFAFSASSQ